MNAFNYFYASLILFKPLHLNMLKAKGIFKNYGALPVLKGVNIEILKGEIVSIAGSSGAGKSTLLHILGTLDIADKGEIYIDNTPVFKLNGKKLAAFRNKHIGFVFQFHHLLPEFTALENVCIPGWIAGRKTKAVQEKALSLLELLGLKDRSEHKPGELSGGEQQRVGIARALSHNPDLIIADEPTGNLDKEIETEVMGILVSLAHKEGKCVIIVTHSNQIASYADEVWGLVEGKLLLVK